MLRQAGATLWPQNINVLQPRPNSMTSLLVRRSSRSPIVVRRSAPMSEDCSSTDFYVEERMAPPPFGAPKVKNGEKKQSKYQFESFCTAPQRVDCRHRCADARQPSPSNTDRHRCADARQPSPSNTEPPPPWIPLIRWDEVGSGYLQSATVAV